MIYFEFRESDTTVRHCCRASAHFQTTRNLFVEVMTEGSAQQNRAATSKGHVVGSIPAGRSLYFSPKVHHITMYRLSSTSDRAVERLLDSVERL